MTLNKGGIATSPFGFEQDIVAALANREIEAAAVTPAAVGWFNRQHADKPLRLIPSFEKIRISTGTSGPDCFAPTTTCDDVSMRRSRHCWRMAR